MTLIGAILVTLSCSNIDANNPDEGCGNCPVARKFNIDTSQASFIVDVFGRKLTTPDWAKIDKYLNKKHSEKIIDHLWILETGIEGGASYCVVIDDNLARASLLEDLKSISTNLAETSYRIESVADCRPAQE